MKALATDQEKRLGNKCFCYFKKIERKGKSFYIRGLYDKRLKSSVRFSSH